MVKKAIKLQLKKWFLYSLFSQLRRQNNTALPR